MIDTVAEIAKIAGWITIIVFFVAICISIIETSYYASKKRREEASAREVQNEVLQKALEQEIPKAVGEAVRQLMYDSIKQNKD